MFKQTKKALALSMITLILCLGMLIGTTYAWFTDSASSSGNIIQAGNLDVAMQWADGTKALADENWTSEGAIFNNNKWEPGYVEAKHIKISNNGSLALKYQVVFETKEEVSKLAEVIDVYYVDHATVIKSSAELAEEYKIGTLKDVLANLYLTASGKLLSGEADTITLALKMQEDASNEYQGLSIGGSFTIKVVATQVNYEEDSFGPNYDAGSPWLGGVDTSWYNETDTEFVIYTAEELAGFAAITNGANLEGLSDDFAGKTVKLGNNIDLNNLNWTPIANPMSDGFEGFAGTFDGEGYTISNLNVNNPSAWGQGLFGYNANKSTVIKNFTIENVNVNAEDTSGAVAGYFQFGTFENIDVMGSVTIKGAQHMGGIVGNGYYTNISNCSVVANAGSKITATAGSFVGGIVGYHGGEKCSILNCTVKNLENTAVGAVGAITGIVCTSVTIKGCVAENVVLNKTNADSYPSIGLVGGTWSGNNTNANISNNTFKNITLNGTAKEYPHNILLGSNYEGTIDPFKGTVENNATENITNNLVQGTIVGNVNDLDKALQEKDVVILNGDLTFNASSTTANSGYGATGISVKGNTFDGNGNTLTVQGASGTWDSAIHTTGGTIKNVTAAGSMRGIFMSGATGDVYIENVSFNTIYTFNSDAGSKEYGVYIKNSTMNGWTSYSNVHKEVVFENCKFTEGKGYAFLRAYNSTDFKNCVFDSNVNFELEVVSGAIATFENCYYGETLITAENITTLGLLYNTDSSRVEVK